MPCAQHIRHDAAATCIYDIGASHQLAFLGLWSDDHNNPDAKTAAENDMQHHGRLDVRNRTLDNPRAIHGILTLSHLLSENTRITLEGYMKRYDRFPLDPDQPELFLVDELTYRYGFYMPHGRLVSTGTALSQGLELTVQKKLARDVYGIVCASWTASRTARQEVFDRGRVNGARNPAYHSLNLRVDRRFHFENSALVTYLSVWNAYNRKNVAGYIWDDAGQRVKTLYQWGMLPIIGVEWEF